MRAIVIAAGMGRRLSPYTDDRPKCLVDVAGQPMLKRALSALRSQGVTEFCVVTGYRGEQLVEALRGEAGVTFVENRSYARNNILCSLMHAEAAMDEGFLCTYSDIVFHPSVVSMLVQARGDLTLAVDPYWKLAYEGRTEHPVAEAELCAQAQGRVTQVGKRAVGEGEACGEFIGLWRASAAAAKALRALFHRRKEALGLDAPYGRATRFEVAYLTDLFNDLIGEGFPIEAALIQTPNAWREIDTVQDLERAASIVTWS